MSRPMPDVDGMYSIIWPSKRKITAETLIMWASDDVNNEYGTEDYRCSDVDEAIDVLLDTGSVTFGNYASP